MHGLSRRLTNRPLCAAARTSSQKMREAPVRHAWVFTETQPPPPPPPKTHTHTHSIPPSLPPSPTQFSDAGRFCYVPTCSVVLPQVFCTPRQCLDWCHASRTRNRIHPSLACGVTVGLSGVTKRNMEMQTGDDPTGGPMCLSSCACDRPSRTCTEPHGKTLRLLSSQLVVIMMVIC